MSPSPPTVYSLPSLSVVLLTLLLALVALSPCAAQSTRCSSSLQVANLTSGSAPLTYGNVSCNATAYAANVYVTVVSAASTGNLSWTAAVYATPVNGITSFGNAIGPVSNGTVSSCQGISNANRVGGVVGALYSLSLSCAANGTGLQGQCNAAYNLTLQCVQAPSDLLSSSTGYNAAASSTTAFTVWAALLLSAVMAVVSSATA